LLEQRLSVEGWRSDQQGPAFRCETGWTPLDDLSSGKLLRIPASADESTWRWHVSIFQRNLTPRTYVTQQDLSTITVGGPHIDLQPRVNPALLPPFNIDGTPPAKCEVTTTPPSDDALLNKHVHLPARTLDSTGFIRLLSGGSVSVLVSPLHRGEEVTLRFFAKSIEEASSGEEVCNATLTADNTGDKQRIVATWPWAIAGERLWTVAIETRRPSPAIELAVYGERPPLTPSNASANSPSAYSCTGIRDAVLPLSEGRSVFHGVYALTIDTGLSAASVGNNAYTTVIDALLNAINLWRSACTSCSLYQFSVVQVDGTVYVPSNMLQGQADKLIARFLDDMVPDKNMGPFVMIEQYVPVPISPEQRTLFCHQVPEKDGIFSAAESPLCRATTASNDREMVLHFRWARDEAPCSGEADAIACWNGADLISMNLRDFSFYAGDVGSVVLGTAPHQVDLVRVFAHEAGHWLGLGHLNSGTSIMQTKFSHALCLDNLTLSKLNQIDSEGMNGASAAEALHYGD
jgi:hypothetical protein